MVQMLVQVNGDSGPLKEWAIVEIQGDLQSSTGESIAGKQIGQLIFYTNGRPTLIIGCHILLGKVVEQNPPFAVLKRSRALDTSIDGSSPSTDYSVLALVKKKITFRTRPKPIVSLGNK